ncbi:hypothetical protein [Litorihabitans aurantiacus]|uniref:Integral membrane protein n=1 Tax=Litorihabitans aurantiacus TaxID=1930061 RepID=A0AA37UV30_9MICO|nr:hypothetical protein [Litorihabitans aurantiacus]GMA30951.1 hypothetical protein GCM10025875_09430 [Litorihabitans aurantiacus]
MGSSGGPTDAGPWGGGNPYGPPPGYGPSGYASPGYGPPGAPYGGSSRPAPATAGAATSLAFSRFGRAAGPMIGLFVILIAVSVALEFSLTSVLAAAGLEGPYGDLTEAGFREDGLSYTGTLIVALVTAVVTGASALLLAIGSLRAVRTGSLRFSEFFALPRGWAAYVGVAVALSVLPELLPSAGGGLVLGLAALVGWVLVLFVPHHLADSDQGFAAALAASARTVGANLGQVLLLMLISLGLVVAGTLACGVGLLAAVPIVSLALAALYTGFRGEVVPA